MTFVQRFGDALNLNVHFHSLVLDGIYVTEDEGRIVFRPVPPPSDAELLRVTQRIIRRIESLMKRRGVEPKADADESDAPREPLLAELYSASIAGQVATGHRITKVGDEIDLEHLPGTTGPRCVCVSGFSVHANGLRSGS